MSAHQMICHLGDAMRVAAGQKTASAASGLAQRTIVKSSSVLRSDVAPGVAALGVSAHGPSFAAVWGVITRKGNAHLHVFP
jgi:hypothetical protein